MYLIISILFHICKSSIRTIISILNIKACHCFPAQNTLQSADGENCCLARTTLWPVTWEHPNCTAFKKNSLETFPLFRSKQFFTVMISNIKITGLLHQTKTTGNDKIQIRVGESWRKMSNSWKPHVRRPVPIFKIFFFKLFTALFNFFSINEKHN